MQLDPGVRWSNEVDVDATRAAGGRPRFRIRKPRLPWAYRPRQPRDEWGVECGGRRMRWSFDPGDAVRSAWFKKNCVPRKARRVFDPGGAESGTLSGARRAAGLFDENWDREFPLTRKEREVLAAGGQVADPFFAPPTGPAPENWIDDKLQRLRGTFGPTRYQTPKGLLPFCPEGGFGITCAGPDGEVGWTGGTVPLTPLDVARFKDAYCAPGQCQTGGKASPPPGYKEFVIKVKPRNPAVRLKASCQPVLAPEPVVMDWPPLPPAAPPAPAPAVPGAISKGCPPGHYWAVTTIGCRCMPNGSGGAPASAERIALCGIVL